MTVASVKTGADPEVLKLGLSDGSLFFIRFSYLSPELADPSRFYPGAELDEAEVAELRSSSAAFRVERAALRLIAGREHSAQSLALKLRKKEHPECHIARVMAFLCSRSLVDDGRFARLWLESRMAHHFEGRQKLLRGLLSRGVGEGVAKRALAEVVPEEVELGLLRRFLEKERHAPAPGDPALAKELFQAGFRPALLRRLLEDE